ncbi:unnamed protein product [Parajaminaea phylloscopi]
MAKGDRKSSLSRIFARKKGTGASSSASSASTSADASPATTPAKSPAKRAAASSTVVAEPDSIPSDVSTPASPSAKRGDSRANALARNRSGSLSERGAAVLRALQRAPADESPDDGTPSGSLTPHPESNGHGEDDGYDPTGRSDTSPARYPHPDAHFGGVSADVSRAGSIVGLSEEQKQSGRLNREGLRKRGEAKEVEKMVGKTRTGHKRRASGDGKKSKKSWEIPRKIFHSSHGFLVLYLYLSHHNLADIVRALSIFLGIVITADVIRLNNAGFEKVYEKVLGFLMRESEKDKVNGVVWYLVGVIFSLHFYPADIACVSIMILSWADTAASVFGRLFGRYTPPLPSPPFASRKSLSGFLAAWLAAGAVACLFWGTNIAKSAERFDGLSWNPAHAVLGATAPGWQNSGWSGLRWGFRGHLPQEIADSARHGTLNAAWDAASRAASSIAQAASSDVPSNAAPGMPLPVLAIGSGLVAAVAEGLELGGLDDNLSLPILSGFGIWAWLFAWGKLAVAYTRASNGSVLTT